MAEPKQKGASFSGVYGVLAALITCGVFGASFSSHFAREDEITELRGRQAALETRIDFLVDQIEQIAIQVGAKTLPKPPRRGP